MPTDADRVLDLARGLQFQSHLGMPGPGTASLLIRLGGPQITAADARRRPFLAKAGPPPGSGRPGQPGEARRSSSSSACPDSTPVRISRATASSSATCGLVSE